MRACSASTLLVDFPVFRGDDSEDVNEFIDNFRRAAKLNGWSEENLALGLPLFLKGHASAWFKSLQNSSGLSFDELISALIERFASGANEWRIRQALSNLRQHEKETVADYLFNVSSLCSRLNLPRSEWIHYFVQG